MHFALDISVLRIAQAGVLVYTRNLIEHLVAEGAEHQWTLLDLLPLNYGKPMSNLRAFDAPNVRVVRLPGLKRGYASMLPGLRAGLLHSAAERVDNLFDRPWSAAATAAVGLQLRAALRGVELFHSSDQFVYSPPGASALLTIHDLTTLVHPEWHVHQNTAMHSQKERFAAERADHLIAVSQATKRDIITHLGVPPERISVVYEAADERFQPYRPDQAQPALDHYGLQASGYIFSLGTVEPRKNYLRLIEAYALLHKRFANRDQQMPPLVIAGGYGWLYEEVLSAPNRFGLGQSVHLLGKVPDHDLPALMAGAAIFVYPSLYEGFGLPVLEAMASGVPVVASNISSLPEVLGDAGLYCDPLDVGSIAEMIETLLCQPNLAAGLRAAGPKRAVQFSWRRMAHETLDIYAQVVAKRHP